MTESLSSACHHDITVAVADRPEERRAGRLGKKVGDQQLRLCSSLVIGMSDLMRQQLQLSQSQRQAARRDEIVQVTESSKRIVTDLQELRRLHADFDCMEHLHRSVDGKIVCLVDYMIY